MKKKRRKEKNSDVYQQRYFITIISFQIDSFLNLRCTLMMYKMIFSLGQIRDLGENFIT